MPKKTNKIKIKVYHNEEIENVPLPELLSYENILYTPTELKDINETEAVKLAGIEEGADITATHQAASIVNQGDLAILDQVGTAQIVNQAVAEANLADLAVSEIKLKDAAVVLAKLADEAVNADKIWKGGSVITLSAQIQTGIILNAHIGSLAAQKITSQLVDTQIANIGWAKILNVAIVDADIINLTVEKLTGNILTGKTVRTAATNYFRLEMRRTGEASFPNELVWYSSANTILERIGGSNYGDLVLYCTNTLTFLSGGGVFCQGHYKPSSGNSYDLGDSNYTWRNLYLAGDGYIKRGADNCLRLLAANVEVFKHFVPNSDNSFTCGSGGQRWSDVRSVLINGADYGFEHQWWLTENYKIGIKEEGIAVLNPKNELMLFIGETGLYVKDGLVKNLNVLPYIKTTVQQRSRMDKFVQLRKRDKSSKELLKIPEPKEAKIGGGEYKERLE